MHLRIDLYVTVKHDEIYLKTFILNSISEKVNLHHQFVWIDVDDAPFKR